jgi:hypothetical protein
MEHAEAAERAPEVGATARPATPPMKKAPSVTEKMLPNPGLLIACPR